MKKMMFLVAVLFIDVLDVSCVKRVVRKNS